MLLLSIKERVTQALNTMSDKDLLQVEEFVTFLRFRARLIQPPMLNTTELASLYAVCTDEDRSFANEGMSDYQSQLYAEDQA